MPIINAALADMTTEETRSFYVVEWNDPTAQKAEPGFSVYSCVMDRDAVAKRKADRGRQVIVYSLIANFSDSLGDAHDWLRENTKIAEYFDIE